MINKKMIASLLVSAATLVGTLLPTMPAMASNNNAALNMMAMQMYMQQQANAQNQAILAQEQANATYAAAQAAWAANTIPSTSSQVGYCAPQTVVYTPAPVCSYVAPVYTPVVAPVVHVIERVAYNIGHDFRGGHNQYVAFRGRR